MEPFAIRPAISSDIQRLMAPDHSYSTDFVWQMALQTAAPTIEIAFREVRLPRPMRVAYPRRVERLADEWTERSVVLVGDADDRTAGYLALAPAPAPEAMWITDLVVDPPFRRPGLGPRRGGGGLWGGRGRGPAP